MKIYCIKCSAISLTSIVFLMLLILPSLSIAQYNWNFERQSVFGEPAPGAGLGQEYFGKQSCGRVGEVDRGCSAYGNGDSKRLETPFLHERYIDENGKHIFHMIVGEPASGFAQEVYMEVGDTDRVDTYLAGFSPSKGAKDCTNGGTADIAHSACNILDSMDEGYTNGNDFSGNGSGNPKRVVIRQVMGGSWDATTKTWSCGPSDEFCNEFFKGEMLKKPVISQVNRDLYHNLEASWQMDMRNSDYDTSSIAGIMDNNLTLAGIGGADFDYSKDGQAEFSNINGGKYVYTGGDMGELASANAYFYEDGGDFVLDADWKLFKNADQSQYQSSKCTSC